MTLFFEKFHNYDTNKYQQIMDTNKYQGLWSTSNTKKVKNKPIQVTKTTEELPLLRQMV